MQNPPLTRFDVCDVEKVKTEPEEFKYELFKENKKELVPSTSTWSSNAFLSSLNLSSSKSSDYVWTCTASKALILSPSYWSSNAMSSSSNLSGSILTFIHHNLDLIPHGLCGGVIKNKKDIKYIALALNLGLEWAKVEQSNPKLYKQLIICTLSVQFCSAWPTRIL